MFRPEDGSVRVGLPFTPLTDLYYLILQGSWARVLSLFAVLFLLVNVAFAGLYLAGGDCITGARSGSFADAFFFSVQTIATIGYGGLSPATLYANVLVTLESMIGILGVALATGMIFAKFARPRANVTFSSHALIGPYDGRRSLYFRVANVRGNDVSEASIGLSALIDHQTAEGHKLRRLEELKLTRSKTPLFRLSWLVVHVIDETSPLWGKTLDELYRDRVMLVISMTGMDTTIVFDHHFVDLMTDRRMGGLSLIIASFTRSGR